MAKFSIGTFNLYNLQLAGALVYENRLYTENTYDRKVGWVGAQIRRMKCDILGFQEVWSAEALQDAAARSGQYSPEQVFVPRPEGVADGSTIAVGLATRLPVRTPPVAVWDFPDGMCFDADGVSFDIKQFSRPVLACELELPGEILTKVYVAHLKSKRPLFNDGEDKDDPRIRAAGYARALLVRAAEAAALRCLLLDDLTRSDTPVVVIGDLNDGVTAVTTQIIAGDQPWRRAARAKKEAAWDILMYSTYELQAMRSYRDVYYTHIFNRRYETLDHILVSEEFVPFNPDRIASFVDMTVLNDHVDDFSDRERSDHAQVIAHFRTS
ncbi:MAG: endonuclease/exonuclease/phosphatase family protein [Myxococcota bacterium]